MIKLTNIIYIKNISNSLQSAKLLIVVNIQGIIADQLQKFRKKINEYNLFSKTYKNIIFKTAIKLSLLKNIIFFCKGQNSIIWDNIDRLLLIKIFYNIFPSINNLSLNIGFYKNQIINFSYIKYLTKIPSLLILKKQLLALILNIFKKIIYSLQFHMIKIIKYLNIQKPRKLND